MADTWAVRKPKASRQMPTLEPIQWSELNRLYRLVIGPDDLDLVDDLSHSVDIGNRLLGKLLVKEARQIAAEEELSFVAFTRYPSDGPMGVRSQPVFGCLGHDVGL